MNHSKAQIQTNSVSVYFPFDSSVPSEGDLEELEQNLSSSTIDTLYVFAYCDIIGSHRYNDSLAQMRQKAILDWIEEKETLNLENAKIIAKAFGKRKPINANETKEQRKLNRRVDVRWVNRINSIVDEQEVDKESAPSLAGFDIKEPLLETNQALVEQIEVAKQTGKSLALKNINFIGGRARFQPSSAPSLKELLQLMRNNPDLQIEIQGHVCCTSNGADGPNIETGGKYLSLDRAKAVYDYLVINGIDSKRMRYKGFGGSKKIYNPERNDYEANQNRRVEIAIIK